MSPTQMGHPFYHSCFIFQHTDDDTDILDEALYYFKANVFFKSYEVKVMMSLATYIHTYMYNLPPLVLNARHLGGSAFCMLI